MLTDSSEELTRLWSGIWWLVLLRGIVAVILGALLIFRPGIVVAVLVSFMGAYWFIDGLLMVIASVKGRQAFDNWKWGMFVGIISMLAGTIVFSRPLASALLTTTFLIYLLGFAAIFSGITNIMTGIRLRKQITNEWSIILGGAMSLLFGMLLIGAPAIPILILVYSLGIMALAGGIILLITALRLRRAAKD